jgi:elongation factor G
MQLPIGQEGGFRGFVDLLRMKSEVYYDEMGNDVREEEVPADMLEKAKEYRAVLVEKIVENDESAMNRYLAGEEIPLDELKKIIRKATIAGTFIPILCGSALKNKGVQFLLDAIVDYLPSPLDVPPIVGHDPDDETVEILRHADDSEPFTALAFKVAADPFVGKLTFFRVYSGTLKSGSYALNSSTGEKERFGRIVRLHANTREDVEEVYAGDIAAAVGLKSTTTGNTLCDLEKTVLLEKIVFPEPVISLAIEPKTKQDQEKMGMALQKLAEEDPTFRVHTDEETMQTIIAGMGELHLDIIVDRMKREFKVEANVGAPQVAFKEAIRGAAEAEGKYVKQSGGRGQFGHCWIKVEPNEGGKGFEFIDAVKGGVIPKEYIAPIEKGIKETMQRGVLAGYPMLDIIATVYDGSYHEVDSSEAAFKVAGSMAFREACTKAGLMLLEPVMKVEVLTPESNMGDVIGNISSKRGVVREMRDRVGIKVVDSEIPLASMFGYATELRSMTQGRASYSMEFSHYAEVPRNVATEVIEGRKK